jgi:hypothetical protein
MDFRFLGSQSARAVSAKLQHGPHGTSQNPFDYKGNLAAIRALREHCNIASSKTMDIYPQY